MKLKRLVRKIAKKINPALAESMDIYEILSQKFGQFRSMDLSSCLDADNKPIPWYTYPAIEYIKQLDLSDKVVFEYGSGNSTLFWSEHCKNLFSVEDDPHWFKKIRESLTQKKR
jgi:hypothetical protein